MKNLKISYQNLTLEAPYAYAAVFEFEIKDCIRASFSMEYVDREEISQQELEANGFGADDDFEWSGELSKNWLDDLATFNTKTYEEDTKENIYLFIEIDGVEKGFSPTPSEGELVLHQLIQAIYETAKLEAPLSIQTANPDLLLNWHFSTKTFYVNKEISHWDIGQDLMSKIYSIDGENIKPLKSKPSKFAINFGEDEWYPILDENILNTFKKIDL